jgi:hypothetical protein
MIDNTVATSRAGDDGLGLPDGPANWEEVLFKEGRVLDLVLDKAKHAPAVAQCTNGIMAP